MRGFVDTLRAREKRAFLCYSRSGASAEGPAKSRSVCFSFLLL
ncbi:hypothetical protein B4123_2500 [Bacillus paralicheniformis]|nr:hypothetical protein B4123_2500 [Bacillus paralicheniformis]TWJ66445.1 hypothetical protein CHCC5021_0721 [Bacillus paralicheniformis]TWL04145.1 hypothetical protein CHCC19468_1003 [Bacillus paralicheniformis]TWL10044.1 hypothetical protein CHCC19467_2316 [Bacillus paralicheniformis]TWL46395.1 hypothetical protein CHCC15337_1986 [Bacillus paralicheniformis]